MNTTPRLILKKPEYIEAADIEDINYNSDVLDNSTRYNEDETITNRWTFASGLIINVPAGNPPFEVNDTTMVNNLNANYIGGYSAEDLIGSGGGPGSISPSGTDKSLQYNANGKLSGDSSLVWDYTNKRLGIGTDSPSNLLSVYGNENGPIRSITTNASSGTSAYTTITAASDTANAYLISFSSKYSNTMLRNKAGLTTDSSSSELFIRTQGSNPIVFYTNNTETMRILADGKVGIGTGSPAELLHIHSNVDDGVRISITNPNTGTLGRSIIKAASSSANIYMAAYSPNHTIDRIKNSVALVGGTGTSELLIKKDGDSPITFWTNDIERMRITGDGKVGIGTDNPDNMLHIYSSSSWAGISLECAHASSNAAMIIKNVSGRNGAVQLWEGGTRRWSFGTNSGNFVIQYYVPGWEDILVVDSTNQNLSLAKGKKIIVDHVRAKDTDGLALYDKDGNGLFINDGGKVGVGTNTPLADLHINYGSSRLGRVTSYNVGSLQSGSDAGARRFEIARIGYSQGLSWGTTSTIIIEMWQHYYDTGYKKYVINAGYNTPANIILAEAQGGSYAVQRARVVKGDPVVSGSDHYLPIFVEICQYYRWEVVIRYAMTETASDEPSRGQIRIYRSPSASQVDAFVEDDIVEVTRATKFKSDLAHTGSKIGFLDTAPIAKPTVTGSRGGNDALASLLTALSNLGLITNSSS